jgi:phosphatidate cytidylyltransferase
MVEEAIAPAVKSKMADLRVRAVSGVVLILIVLGALWAGGWIYASLLALGGMILIYEWVRLVRLRAMAALPLATWLLAGLVYIVMAVTGLMVIRHAGIAIALWSFAIVWATDIGAYFAGRAIGGPKLAPSISPAKTWSGLMGGALAALVVGAGITIWQGLPSALLWLGAPLAVLAQAGDLLESHMKRKAGVKDSGSFIPGHGGLFDRVDGLLPIAIVMGVLVMGHML